MPTVYLKSIQLQSVGQHVCKQQKIKRYNSVYVLLLLLLLLLRLHVPCSMMVVHTQYERWGFRTLQLDLKAARWITCNNKNN